MSKKIIITFEGIEGSGKSLHIQNVSKYLKKKKIRKLILSNKSKFNKNTDLLLYMASRSENVENIIKKNYKKKVILIDRFTDSTIAYQHYGMGIDKKIIKLINNYLLKKISVGFTFLHIVNKKNLKHRLLKRKVLNRYDKFKNSFYEKIQKGYINQANLRKKKYLIINSNIKINMNKKIILNKISKILNI